MKEFCADVDKFMEDSKMTLKNGDMKRFWDEKEKTNAEIKSDDEGKHGESSENKEEGLKWWNTKERKLKVKEILRKREEENQKSKDTKNIEIVKEDSKERKETSSSQGVYDLLNLKTCPPILLSDMKSYPKNEDISLKSVKIEANDEDRSSRLFNPLFDEMNRKNDTSDQFGKISKSISTELLNFEEREKIVEDSSDADAIPSDCETVKNKSVRIEILEANPVSVASFDNDDEVSESESVKTVINKYEINEQGNVDTDIRKEESLTVNEAQNNTKHLDTKPDDAAISSSLEKCQSFKSHKRSLNCEYLNVASKKSHLIEEMDAEGDSSNRKTTSALSEKCRRHFMKEARKFTKKESPLIDKCIESLITNRNSEGNWKVKCNQEDFLNFTATSLNSDFPSGKTKDNSSEQSRVRSKKISENQEIVKESELFSRQQSGK
ncbi:hypothetical protein K0M31_006576 [Melipona bicolor]|uniref:Uncharacterized protein n=1 Tax=Melipona bicolor TaxID=60889 RepID=A0AA40KL27_9HYME|nr:hypothetical protein K0M31_006576 [Melipona bicolor]